MVNPKFDLDKIKFSTDEPTYKRAVGLYENHKVTQFQEGIASFTSVVLGTKPYRVSIEARDYNYGSCECYLGQNDTLCKHIVATAIHAVLQGQHLTKEEKTQITTPITSHILGELGQDNLRQVKKEVTNAISYIKYYRGPSRTWFAYQNSLDEGVNRLSTIVSKLPISVQTANLLVNMLLRLDRKLKNGVDDSNGTVGGFIKETVDVLKEYAKQNKKTIKAFKKLVGIHSTFDWEEPLVKML